MCRVTILGLLLTLGCGGGLSEEQRRQLREAQQQQAIMKVSEADLIAAAFERGRELGHILQQLNASQQQVDSIGSVHHAVIRWRDISAVDALQIEQQLIEAYLTAASSGSAVADNVQRIGTDTLLYTLPITRYRPDSVLEVVGVWSIRMAKKHVVLGISDQ